MNSHLPSTGFESSWPSFVLPYVTEVKEGSLVFMETWLQNLVLPWGKSVSLSLFPVCKMGPMRPPTQELRELKQGLSLLITSAPQVSVMSMMMRGVTDVPIAQVKKVRLQEGG